MGICSEKLRLCKALSNAHRFRIIEILLENEECVGALEDKIGLSQSALSQHLARMRQDGLLKTRRNEQRVFYSIADDRAAELVKFVTNL